MLICNNSGHNILGHDNEVCVFCSHKPFAKIKQYRIDHNLTQKQLASLVKVNIRTVQRWETGELNPSPMVWVLLELLEKKL